MSQAAHPASLSYDDALAYFSTLKEFAPRTGRDRFRALLARLGNPHRQLRTLHVAGTNGKGSTVTFLASVLRAAGYRVGAYLSPYVWDVRERWQIDGELIPREELAQQVAAIRPHVEAIAATEYGPITEFEMKTAVAFHWFAQRTVNFAIIEVGIGGRLDSTNVIPPPLVSVITSIGWDHQNLLGDTLGKIAAEKAGIIKRGTLVCVTGVTQEEPLAAIREKAGAEAVPLQVIGEPDLEAIRRIPLQLRGDFQQRNAACAAAAARTLHQAGVAAIPEAVLRRGLEQATLPGRFQFLAATVGEAEVPVVLDVAHNADAARVLADALRSTFGGNKNAVLVVGMSKGHDPSPFLAELAPLTREIIATAPRFRPRPVSEVAQAGAALGIPVTREETVASAVHTACRQAARYRARGESSYVVVTGSFYTVGETPADNNAIKLHYSK